MLPMNYLPRLPRGRATRHGLVGMSQMFAHPICTARSLTSTHPLTFLVIPLFDMILFSIFVSAALAWRRDREAHKRLMLLAYISIIAAAVARLPGVLPLGPLAFFGLSFLFVVVAGIYDFFSRGRVHKVYLWGGALFAASVPARLALSGTEAWRALAELLTR
jgi:hypothetical protein